MAELVTVRAFTTPVEAHMSCAMLQSAGLDASLRDEHVISMQWLFSNAVGGVKLQVPADQADEALALLGAPARIEDSTGATALDDACPRCGSTDAASVLWGRRPAVLTWLFMGIPLFPVRRVRRCARCGASVA